MKDLVKNNSEKDKFRDTTIMSVENSVLLKQEDKENFVFNNKTDKSKLAEPCKFNYSENYAMQQSMLSGNYAQQMTFKSAQDTGYQTFSSSSNITSNTEYYCSSIKQKFNWTEEKLQTDDEVQLADWKDNMKNMISSTPSKYIKDINCQ